MIFFYCVLRVQRILSDWKFATQSELLYCLGGGGGVIWDQEMVWFFKIRLLLRIFDLFGGLGAKLSCSSICIVHIVQDEILYRVIRDIQHSSTAIPVRDRFRPPTFLNTFYLAQCVVI